MTQAYLLAYGMLWDFETIFSKRVSRGEDRVAQRGPGLTIFGSVETSVFLSRVASAVIDGVYRDLHA